MSLLKACTHLTPPFDPPSSPSPPLAPKKLPNFARVPSWVSLRTTNPSSSPQPHQRGRLENIHLISLSQQGNLKQVHEFLKSMEETDVPVFPSTYKSLFEACGSFRLLSDGKLIHQRLKLSSKNNTPMFLELSALKMFCDCGSLMDAQKLFDEMSDKDSECWGVIVSAYAENGMWEKAIILLSRMVQTGVRPCSWVSFGLLKSLCDWSLLEIGKQIHCQLVKFGSGLDDSVNVGICNMYVRCGWLEGARFAFELMDVKDVVACTGLMVGYTDNGKCEDSLVLFEKMVMEGVKLDEFVFSIALKTCSILEDLETGRQIHGYIVKQGLEDAVSVGTPLVDFYVKCNDFESASLAFEMIREPNDLSWSALLSGYLHASKAEETLKLFASLRNEVVPLNSFTYTSIFQASALLADIISGSQVHADAIKQCLISPLYGESALVTMYAKCGRLDHAYRAFQSIDKPDTVAWTALISGYAYHGSAHEAVRLFKRMQESREKPNQVTFMALLTACSHSNLVAEAKEYLNSMSDEYGVDPTIDHFNCMVDVYSRSGLLWEAFDLINNMPFQPDAMSWKCLLSGCWNHKNLELGKIASENLLKLDPHDTAGYILLFNLFTFHGLWEEAANIRREMTQKNLRKELSCSWITVKGKVHRFVVGDRHHPQTKEIYAKLKEIDFSVKSDADSVSLLTEEDLPSISPKRKQQLLDHSERLAIAFGLISMPGSSPIFVFKNLRACKSCHDFAKHVSIVEGREIVVRDTSRFHHFKSGQCSCGDYW